jgi:choline dehydrogenase
MRAADVIIAGGGTAGCLLAARLSEDPNRKVLLLEKGDDYPSPEELPACLRYGYFATQLDHPECPPGTRGQRYFDLVAQPLYRRFVASPVPGREGAISRGEVIGGCSAVNAGIYLWGVREDYDEWAAAGNPLWSFARVRRSFAEIETDLDFPNHGDGVHGPIRVRRAAKAQWQPFSTDFFTACRALGHAEAADFNDPEEGPTGVGPLPFNLDRGVRVSAAMAFLGPEVRQRRNLQILGRHEAQRILIDSGKAVGVAVRTEGVEHVYRADEIVLSCGAIGTPQLLLLSGIGPRAELHRHGIAVVHELPGVGATLMDHPVVSLSWAALPQPGDGEHTGFELALRYTAPESPYRADVQINCQLMQPTADDAGNHMVRTGTVGLGVHLYRVLGSGTLRLRSARAEDPPVLDYRYLADAQDRARMRSAVRHGFEIAAQPAVARNLRTPERLLESFGGLDRAALKSDAALDAWLDEQVTTGEHSAGTCRMGPASDGMAVVDQTGQVHGVQGLRVVDASIMPHCVRANTNAPTMMIAQHVAKMMLGRE